MGLNLAYLAGAFISLLGDNKFRTSRGVQPSERVVMILHVTDWKKDVTERTAELGPRCPGGCKRRSKHVAVPGTPSEVVGLG